ncbi:hypothetical protein ACVL91_009415 [Bradyrhizobium elkanii]
MEWHREHAAQRRERAPHVLVLDQIGEVLIGGKSKSGGRAIDHRIHRIGEGAAPRRDRDDDENLDDLLRCGDPESCTHRLRRPGIVGNGEQRVEGNSREAEQRDAGRAEHEGEPHLNRRSGALVGGDDEPQHQQCGGNGGGADNGWKRLKQQHEPEGPFDGTKAMRAEEMAASSADCKPV